MTSQCYYFIIVKFHGVITQHNICVCDESTLFSEHGTHISGSGAIAAVISCSTACSQVSSFPCHLSRRAEAGNTSGLYWVWWFFSLRRKVPSLFLALAGQEFLFHGP